MVQEIQNTPIADELDEIVRDGETASHYTWEMQIHFSDDEKPYDVFRVVAISINRDYTDRFADETVVSVQIPLGTYARFIYPNRIKLEATLTRKSLFEVKDSVNTEKPTENQRYTAVLIEKPGMVAPTVAQGNEGNTEEGLNHSQILDVDFQIYDKFLEQLRVAMVGTVVRDVVVEDAITTILGAAIESIKVDDDLSIEGIDMIPADNKDKRDQLVITQGMRLVDVPDYIQHRWGVYNSGLGHYIQNRYWFVYPLYNTTIYKKAETTLTIYIYPKRKLWNSERTYKKVGSEIRVIANGDGAFTDDSGIEYLNGGNGGRFAAAAELMDSNLDTKDNKTLYARNKHNTEVMNDPEIVGRVNYSSMTSGRMTANPFKEYTKMAARRGGHYKCIWENSDQTLLYPGMPVKIVYNDLDNIKQFYGILHSNVTITHRYSNFASQRFKNQTVLIVFVNNQMLEIE